MNIYGEDLERDIAAERTVREWNRSGLLDQVQLDQVLPTLQSGLRRTNVFLRLILFAFTALIIAASFLLIIETFDFDSDFSRGMLCSFGAITCLLVAERLASRFRLYRFGVEEAAAAAVVVNAGLAAMFLSEWVSSGMPGEFPEFIGLMTAAAVAWGIFLRFGYLYAAVGSMLCLSAAPSQLNLPEMSQRLIVAAILAGICARVRSKRREYGDDFPGDRYGVIQSIAFLGIYACLNLAPSTAMFGNAEFPRSFYWFTYAMILLLPAGALYLAIRDKDRPLLDASLVMILGTLVSNKSYLGLVRESWDPILLGVFLIGTALAVRRWLASGSGGMRHGFTPSRILTSDQRALSVVGTVSVFTHAAAGVAGTHTETTASPAFKPGGGRSGGAGAGSSF
jgi:hypothetical protein